jgi:hypothetical protein
MAHVRPVLQQLQCTNETVRNVPKYKFWVQWIGSGALVVKNSEATFVPVRPVLHRLSALTKRTET